MDGFFVLSGQNCLDFPQAQEANDHFSFVFLQLHSLGLVRDRGFCFSSA
jgi:hypothetical protein